MGSIMKKNILLIVWLVVVFSMSGCSHSSQNSNSHGIKDKEILKVEEEKYPTITPTITPTVMPTTQPNEIPINSDIDIKDNSANDISYEVYYNDRFDFSIKYPDDFITETLPANGDGIVLKNLDGNAELTVSGINNLLGDTAESCYDDFIKSHEKISYKKQNDNWFVASWLEDDNILYQKEVVGTGSINTFIIKYPLNEQEYYDEVIISLLESFETPGISETHAMILEEQTVDDEKVLNLFIEHYLIESPDTDNTFYALKGASTEFLYTVKIKA